MTPPEQSSTDFPGQPRGRGDTISTGPAEITDDMLERFVEQARRDNSILQHGRPAFVRRALNFAINGTRL